METKIVKSNWTLIGYWGGVAFSTLSAIRYFLMYPDTDKAIVYVIIGGVICALAWLYNQQLQHSNKLTAMGNYLSEKNEKTNRKRTKRN